MITKVEYETFIKEYDGQRKEIERRFKLLESGVLFGVFDHWGDFFDYELLRIIDVENGEIEVHVPSIKDYVSQKSTFITNILCCYFDEDAEYAVKLWWVKGEQVCLLM